VRTITFYSYKGGVGRTLSLAWMARALAARGQRVVALDLDVEAPGLHHKLPPIPEHRDREGFVDLVVRFQRGESPPSSIREYLAEVQPISGSAAPIWVCKAGKDTSSAYWDRLMEVSWREFFIGSTALGVEFFFDLRRRLAEEVTPDVLLIDARTGITELGSAALTLLPDTVVCMTSMSSESREGVRMIMRSVTYTARQQASEPPVLVPVLCRIPESTPADRVLACRESLLEYFTEPAEELLASPRVRAVQVITSEAEVEVSEQLALDPGRRTRLTLDYGRLLNVLFPGDDDAAVAPPVREEARSGQGSDGAIQALRADVGLHRELAETDPGRYRAALASALEALASRLASVGARTESIDRWAEAVRIRQEISEAESEGGTIELADSLAGFAELLEADDRLAQALALREQERVIRVRLGDPLRIVTCLGVLARLCARTGSIDRALELFQSRLQLLEQVGDEMAIAATLADMARLEAEVGRLEEALRLEERRLSIARRASSRTEEAAALGGMAELRAKLGDLEGARTLQLQRQKTLEGAHDLSGAVEAALEAARMEDAAGATDQAVHWYREALRRIEDMRRSWLPAALGTASGAGFAEARLTEANVKERVARWYLSRAQEEFRLLTRRLANEAILAKRSGKSLDARRALERLIALSGETASPQERLSTLDEIAQVQKELGNLSEAVRLQEERLHLFGELGDVGGRAKVLQELAKLRSESSDSASRR